MFEPLEPRMLLSGVPAGFVEVGSYTIDTGSATPVMTADLTPGVKHIAVVSGTFKVGGPSSHIADAEYHQRGPTKAWNDLTTLTGHNTDMGLDDASGRLVHWGPHEADAEYEQEFTPTTSDPLELFYRDVEGQGPNGAGSTWYDDNVGSLMVKLYEKATITSLTVQSEVTNVDPETDESTQQTLSVTDADGVITPTLRLQPDSNGGYSINLSGIIEPNSPGAYSDALYNVVDSAGQVVSSGSLPAAGVTTTWTSSLTEFVAQIGIDLDGNGVLGAGEVIRTSDMAVDHRLALATTAGGTNYSPVLSVTLTANTKYVFYVTSLPPGNSGVARGVPFHDLKIVYVRRGPNYLPADDASGVIGASLREEKTSGQYHYLDVIVQPAVVAGEMYRVRLDDADALTHGDQFPVSLQITIA